MDNNNTRSQSDAEWYCRNNPEEERFYEIFFQMCHKHGVRWTSATQEERRFIEEVTKVAYTSEHAGRTS
jgi:hypothetical protein